MPSPINQAAFIGGELAPSLHGRVDLDRYRQAAKLIENFVVDPHGGVFNRSGTVHVARTKEQSQYVRLVKFSPSADENYILEFGPLYIRIYDADTGERIVDDDDAPIEISTPYESGPQDDVGTPNTISELVFTQSVDVMTIAAPNYEHPIYELRRNTATFWTLTTLQNINPPGYPAAVGFPAVVPTGTPKRDWQYAVSGVSNDGTESLAVLSPIINVLIQSTNPLTVRVTAGTLVDHYNVYKGLNGTYGFVGVINVNPQAALEAEEAYRVAYETAYNNAIAAGQGVVTAMALGAAAGQAAAADVSTSVGIVPGVTQFSFTDDNIAPDYTDQPRQSINPFTPSGGLRPACVAYFQQRLVLANVQGKPDTIYMSEVADYKNFQRQVPATPDGSIVATIASSGLNEIRALVPLRHLLVFTSGAEYLVGGSDGGPITPDSIDAVPQSYWGSSSLQPLTVGGVVLFKDVGGHIREWVYDQNQDGYPATDVGILANHLLVDSQVIAWAYSASPRSIIWCVRSDGVLLTFTYVREQSVAAWARHSTDGKFRSVCAARRQGLEGESLWFVVDRVVDGQDVKSIERMDPRADDSVFVDAHVELSNAVSGTATVVPITDYLKGSTVRVITPGYTWSQSLVDTRWIWLIAQDGTRVYARLVGISTTGGSIGESTEGLFELGVDLPTEMQGGATIATWRVAQRVWSGVSHLQSETVSVVADGNAHRDVVVSPAGEVSLDYPAAEVIVGLPYTARLTTLTVTSQREEIRAKQKLVSSVHLFVNATRGLFVGVEGEDATEAKVRDLGTPEAKTGIVDDVRCSNRWEKNGAITVEQRYPLPCHILGVAPEVTVGG